MSLSVSAVNAARAAVSNSGGNPRWAEGKVALITGATLGHTHKAVENTGRSKKSACIRSAY